MSSRAHAIAWIGLAAFATGPLRAQERPAPRLFLSVFGGVAGGSDLWEVNRQPLSVLGSLTPARYDTLRLSRTVKTGFILGVSGTFFKSDHFGLSGEMVFLGLPTGDQCVLVYESPGSDPARRNQQICDSINGRNLSPSTMGFFLGATYRLAPRGVASPYLRAQAGLGVRSGSTVEVTGAFLQGGTRQERLVIRDPGGASVTPSVGGAAGLMIPVGPGYQVRLEIRDQLMSMRRATGPADEQLGGVAPTATRLVHGVALTAGLDIVLEQKRGRRY